MNRKWIGIILAIAIFITLIPAVMAPAQAYGDVFSSVSTGTYHAVAVKADGSLWTWGWNYEGELADGTTTDRYVPTKVMDNVMTASAGWHHTAIIKTDGSLWECGSSWHDSTCDETGANRYAPVKIMDDAKAVSSGDNYNAAIKTDGSLWVWGANYNGQLGDGTITTYYSDEDDVFNKIYIEDNDRLTPVKVLDGVASVSANGVYTMAVKTNGELWGWGYNHYALLGENAYSTKPNPVKLMEGVLLPWQAPAPPAAVTKPTSSTVLVDGEAFLFDAYNINNNNYFKFRDIAQALDFGVTWDGANNTIIIDTSTGYSNE